MVYILVIMKNTNANSNDNKNIPERRKAQKRRGNEIQSRKVDWLMYPYIARGQVTILSADPGVGKTFLALWIAACVSRGLDFPVHSHMNKAGTNLITYLSKEDEYDTLIIPRFKACGGLVENLITPKTEEDMPESFADPMILDYFEDKPDLIVFDAVSSFFGDANMNQANEVRMTLNPILRLARRTGTAVLLICHNNKMSSVHNAQYRVSGSVDFTAFARSGLVVGKVVEESFFDGEQEFYVMAQFKNNLSSIGESLKFETVSSEEDEIGLKYVEVAEYSAGELIENASSGSSNTKESRAKRIIEEILDEQGGSIPVKELDKILGEYHISSMTGYRARKALKLKSVKVLNTKTNRNVNVVAFPDVAVGSQECVFEPAGED